MSGVVQRGARRATYWALPAKAYPQSDAHADPEQRCLLGAHTALLC